MIVEDIVNELDKFITKYKTLKSDNQTLQTSNQILESDKQALTQFKSDVKTALSSKGIISNTTVDTEVVSSINSYNSPTGDSSNYQSLIDNLSIANVFRKTNSSGIESVGRVTETFETKGVNNVKIYSLYTIESVKIADGQYKNRITQTPKYSSYTLTADGENCGVINYNTLTLSIQPQESENINGEVEIKYTVNGQEHSVKMVVQDLKKRSLNGNFYILKQNMFRLNEDNGDLRQQVNVNNTMDRPVIIGSSNVTIKAYTEKPEVFDTLNSSNFGEGPNAIIKFGKKIKIPVKVMMTFYTKIVDLSDGQYAGVLELENDKLYFHYTRDSGKLYERYLIATTEYASKTDSNIVNNFIAYNGAKLIIKNDGSTITDEELNALGV